MKDPDELTPYKGFAAFFVAFGVCILIAVAVTEETAGKIVNLVCGLVFLAVAGGFLAADRWADQPAEVAPLPPEEPQDPKPEEPA